MSFLKSLAVSFRILLNPLPRISITATEKTAYTDKTRHEGLKPSANLKLHKEI